MNKPLNLLNFDTLNHYEAHFCTASFDNNPIIWERAIGSTIIDSQGNKFTDLSACFSSLPLGHNHPTVKKSITQYLENNGIIQGMSDVYATKAKIDFLTELCPILPDNLQKVALTVTGSDAIELAVKTAMLATEKPGVLVLNQGYHGLSLSTMALTGMKKFRSLFIEKWRNHPHISYFNYFDSIDKVENIIKKSHQTSSPIGQIIIEPILGRSGVIPISDDYLHSLKKLINFYHGLMICDEIYTALGRCGEWTLSSNTNCDILCLAKALGGGMPVSAVCSSKEIFSHWPKNHGEALHTGTYFGHPLSLISAGYTLATMKKLNIIDRVKNLSMELDNYFDLQLSKLKTNNTNTVKSIRKKGLMFGIELQGKHQDKQYGVLLSNLLRSHKIIAIPGGEKGSVLTLTPALNINKELLFNCLNTIFNTIEYDLNN